MEIKNISNIELNNSFPDVIKLCSNLIKSSDLRYTIITEKEREQLILSILKRIDEDIYDVGSQKIWNKSWEESYQEFITNNYDLETLVPKFISINQSHYQPLRYNNKFIKPVNNTFWLNYYSIFRQWLFKTFLTNIEYIYEFGCGTGYNLIALAQLHLDNKMLYGLDFSPNSVKIINEIRNSHNYNIEGHLFDMKNPNLQNFKLKENCAILTMNSIEQLGEKFHEFIHYLLEQNPPISLCVHVEPTIEFHDLNNLMDWLSIKFMNKRGYSTTLLTYLKKLESDNKIKIIDANRLPFGNLMSNCYTYIVWKPIQ